MIEEDGAKGISHTNMLVSNQIRTFAFAASHISYVAWAITLPYLRSRGLSYSPKPGHQKGEDAKNSQFMQLKNGVGG